jgi:hypothetical protein
MGWVGTIPRNKNKKNKKYVHAINKKYKFIGLFTDARAKNKNTDLNLFYFIVFHFILFSYINKK